MEREVIVRVMVFNAIVNNISVVYHGGPFLLVE
jgi:hypothetical protein